MPVEIGSYVELADLFPGRECSIEHLAECLGALPLDLVLEMCARANQIASGPSTLTMIDRQRKLANGILSPEALERFTTVSQREEHGGPHKTTLFSRTQLLELTRWALLLCDPDTPPLDRAWNQAEKDLFVQAALICARVSEAAILAVLGENNSVEALKDIALVFFRGALAAGITGVDPWRVVGRGTILFLDLLPRHYPNVDLDFQQATGMTLLEYMTAAGSLVSMHLQLENTMILSDAVTLGHDTQYADVFRAYQDLQVWGIDQLGDRLWPQRNLPTTLDQSPPLDLKPFREKPIIALRDGRGVIPDPVLLADSVTVGPIFHLLGVRDANEVFGSFGDAFEEYVLSIMSRMFPAGERLHRILHTNIAFPASEDGDSSRIDACLDYVDRLVLVEVKAVLIPDRSVIECDEARFRADLERKYLHGERSVGITQLANALRKLAAGTWRGPDPSTQVRLAYPVLVVHDRLLMEPLVTEYLANLLVSELGALRVTSSWQWQLGNLRFAPLTILTIDDLENLECSDGIEFLNLLAAYSSRAPDRKESLHDFMTSYDEFKDRLRINRTLAEAAQAFLADCVRRVFGREPSKEDARE